MEEFVFKRIKNELPRTVLNNKLIRADVLRLDLLHPYISGNKWYKLKGFLRDAADRHIDTIATFGGAYSNHIVATAAACKLNRMKSIGIIRGERSEVLSPALTLAIELGMELIFIPRAQYQLKEVPAILKEQLHYLVPEGGYGLLGMEGAKDILGPDTKEYTHIITPVGTGTTIAGLVEAAEFHQCVAGISSLKNNQSLDAAINNLISPANQDRFIIEHAFHFGGYAKKTGELIQFMNDWYKMTGIPADFVYTAKMFYAFKSLCEENFFKPGSNILLIHTGGLQGNLSLPNGTLIF